MKQKLLAALIMSMITTGVISFTLISVNVGFGTQFLAIWLRSWMIAWSIAVPLILIVGPRIQLMVNDWFNRNYATEEKD